MVFLIFPHQLFETTKYFNGEKIYMIEYFAYSCKIKKILHYASMTYCRDYLSQKGFKSTLVKLTDLDKFIKPQICLQMVHGNVCRFI